MKDRRKAYEQKLYAQFEEWEAQIALLRARTDKATAAARIEYYKTIGALQHRQNESGTKLHELKTAGDEEWEDLKTGAENVWSEVKTAFNDAVSKVQMNATAGHATNSHRSLAEAVILQSIEDLWNPVCKRGSLQFFEGNGFELCCEIAGISYIKQLAILRMLAHAAATTSLHNVRTAIFGKPAWSGRHVSVHTANHDREVRVRTQ